MQRLMCNEVSKDEHVYLFDPWPYEMVSPILGPEQTYHGRMMHSGETVHTYSAVCQMLFKEVKGHSVLADCISCTVCLCFTEFTMSQVWSVLPQLV